MSVLRKLFGPSQAEVWQELSRQIGASFVDGGFWKGGEVRAKVGLWTIVLDTYTVSTGKAVVTFTRMRAPYVNRDGFRFKIARKNFLTGIGKFFGMQDVLVGDPEFDEAFVVKSSLNKAQDYSHVKQFLADEELRKLFLQQKKVSLSVEDDDGIFGKHFEENVDQLRFSTGGIIKDIDQLKLLFDLFAATLHRLCVIGSAYETDPNAPAAIPPVDSLMRPSEAPQDDSLLRPAGSQSAAANDLLRPADPAPTTSRD